VCAGHREPVYTISMLGCAGSSATAAVHSPCCIVCQVVRFFLGPLRPPAANGLQLIMPLDCKLLALLHYAALVASVCL
jgi:hypothetical protein